MMVPRWQLDTALELQYQWGLLTTPQTELLLRPVDLEQGKVLGGGSVINIMLMNLGAPAEFEAWKNFGNPGWDYDGIAPYYRKARSYLGSHPGAEVSCFADARELTSAPGRDIHTSKCRGGRGLQHHIRRELSRLRRPCEHWLQRMALPTEW